jgi:hypothetical protein
MCHSRHHHHRYEAARRSRTWPDETRAADDDREATLVALRDHAAAGRLDGEELDQRLDVALRAQTLGELRRPLADLPGTPPRLGPVSTRHRERSHARRWMYHNAWWAVPLGIWGAVSLVH